jgi:hypothetical protein
LYENPLVANLRAPRRKRVEVEVVERFSHNSAGWLFLQNPFIFPQR